VHVAHYLWLTDNAGNGISYSEYAEAPWGRPLTTQLRKTLTVTGGNHPAPTGSVTSITASPTTLNTLPGNAELTFRLSIQGQSQPVNSWTPNGSVGIHSPSGTQYLWSEFGPAHLISISGATRTYEVVFRLPQYSEQGLWRLDYIQLSGQDSDTPSAYVMSANLSAAGLTPPSFTVQGVDRSWQQELVSLESDKEIVELSFGNLNFLFDGTEKRATATATAASVGLGTENIVFTYNGLTTAPIDVGTYQVVAFLDAPQFRGRAESLLTIINSDPHRVAKHLGRGIYATESGRAYLEPSSPGQPLQNGQSLGNSARLLANATGQPFASASFVTSFDQLALLLGGLTPPRSASLGWRELPAAGVNPRRWEVAVPIFTSAGFASLTIHTFNATNGRLIRSATLNNTTQFLPVLGWESALALDLTGDGIVGDGVLRSLGEGIYVTVSGRVWFDPDKVDGSLTRGQLPGSRARVLSNTLGAALARGSFEAGYDNLVMRLGSQASLGARIVGTTWEVAVPNFTASGFTSLTIHSFNAANGRLIRSTTLSAATQLTDIYAREILFGNSLVGRAGAVIGDRIERSLGGGLFVGQSRALYRSPAEVISQLPTASAVILRNAAGLPLSSSSCVTSLDQRALLLGGLTPPRSASLGWRELPAAGRNPRRWEVAVPNFTAVNNAPRFASLTIHTFNAGNGRLMGSATFNNTTQFLPVLGWESALALDLTGDGIVGDGVLRSLGKGIYVTVSGRVWFDPDKADGSLTRGQLPGSRARVLSNTLGAALARTGFEPGYDNLVTRLGSQASLGARVVGTTWEVAVPNFTSGVFASLTIHTFNQANGRLIRSATFLNSTQFASILTWESRFGLDLDGNGDPGFRFGGVQPGSSPVRVGAVELGLTQVGYALRIGTAIIPVVNNGTLVTASSLAGWTPAAAAAVGTGYQIFLRYLDGRYTQWNVNSAGVVIGRSLLTAGQRRLAEARLAYDINGDGIIGAGRPGIYMGQLATMQGGSGGFAFIVREDGTGAAIAYDRSSGLASGVPEVQVNAEGTFAAESVEGDEITGQVNGQNVQGGFSNAEAQVYGQFTGVRMLDSGTFAGGAGAYEGTFSGSGRQGDAYAIAAADGSFYFYIVNKTVDGFVTETSGGFGRLNSAGAFTTTLSDGIRISVTLNQATKTIAGAYFLGTQRLGNISLTLQPD
jgi:hypothetical protein